MRRVIAIFAHTLAGASAVVFVASSLLTFQSYRHDPVYEFSRRGMRWELAFHDGIVSLDNQPQCRQEAADFAARTAYLQEGLHQAWGTAPWRVRIDYMYKLEREQAAVATPAVAHTAVMLPVISLSAALTTVWIAVGLQHYPKQRRRLARVAFAASGVLALMICIVSLAMAMRSRRTIDLVSKPTRWHYYKGVFGKGGVVLQSFHLVRRTQSVVQTYPSNQQQFALQRQLALQQRLALGQQLAQQSQLTLKQQVVLRQQLALQEQRLSQVTITPVSSYTDAPIPYANSDFARQRESVADVKAERWGAWKWRSMELTPTLSYSQFTWFKEALPLWPSVSTLSSAFGSRIVGRRTLPSQTQEETWLIGHTVWLPYWLLIGVSGAWTWLVFRAVRKARRALKRTLNTKCPECGYDIRATPERCPECGEKLSVHSPLISN